MGAAHPKGQFRVVVDADGQLSIASTHEPLPDDRRDTGKHGTAQECLEYIEGALLGAESRKIDVHKVHLAPRTPMERTVARVWCRNLDPATRPEQVGLYENFFEVGGTSLSLVKACDELSRELGRKVRPVEMFRCPTIRSLAAHLEGSSGGSAKKWEDIVAGGAKRRRAGHRNKIPANMPEKP